MSTYLYCDCGRKVAVQSVEVPLCIGCGHCGTLATRSINVAHTLGANKTWDTPGPKPVPHRFTYANWSGGREVCKWCKRTPAELVNEKIDKYLKSGTRGRT